MPNSTQRPIRYLVFHKPGPKWQYGVDFREQGGVSEHVQHYSKLHQQGKLELGGLFLLQDAFAADDPAVRSGLLIYEVRPWLTAMEHE